MEHSEKVFASRGVAGVLLAGLAAWCILSACATSASVDTSGAAGSSSSVDTAGSTPAAEQRFLDPGAPPAPPFPTGLDWLNTPAPLSLQELRGKVVIIDFWTYGCINCMHDIPWIKKIESDFPDTLVVIGVHSAKFSHSGNTNNIREVILRYGLDYPVVNDDKFQIWNEYGAQGWPTLALLDPQGRVVGSHFGEGFYPIFKPKIESLIAEFSKKGLIDRQPLKLKLEEQGLPQTVLSFPGKVRIDAKHNRLFVADTGHNRIVEAELGTGRVVAVIGSGKQGSQNGGYSQAEFDQPEGMAYSSDGKLLYVADTGNHDIRLVDLAARTVATLDGTGQQAQDYPPKPGIAPDAALSSPWDLALSGNTLYIAMAGAHQIWTMNLETRQIQAFAGSGAEGAVDGPASEAALAQPSGLSLSPDGRRLYFVNSEGSAVRYVDLATKNVVTLAGPTGSLFDYGDRNGIGQLARFQHPLGIVAYDGLVYVADTYNDKIRAINPVSGAVKTLAGGPGSGWRDGRDSLFYEPSGLDAAGGKLYVADTNNHSIRVIDLSTGSTSTLVLKGLNDLSGAGGVYGVKAVQLPPTEVAAGTGVVSLDVIFPQGYAPNAEAPSEIEVSSSAGSIVDLTGKHSFSGPGPRFPISFPAAFNQGTTQLTVNLSVVYCQDQKAQVCLIHQARLEIPVTVGKAAGGKPVLAIDYQVE